MLSKYGTFISSRSLCFSTSTSGNYIDLHSGSYIENTRRDGQAECWGIPLKYVIKSENSYGSDTQGWCQLWHRGQRKYGVLKGTPHCLVRKSKGTVQPAEEQDLESLLHALSKIRRWCEPSGTQKGTEMSDFSIFMHLVKYHQKMGWKD